MLKVKKLSCLANWRRVEYFGSWFNGPERVSGAAVLPESRCRFGERGRLQDDPMDQTWPPVSPLPWSPERQRDLGSLTRHPGSKKPPLPVISRPGAADASVSRGSSILGHSASPSRPSAGNVNRLLPIAWTLASRLSLPLITRQIAVCFRPIILAIASAASPITPRSNGLSRPPGAFYRPCDLLSRLADHSVCLCAPMRREQVGVIVRDSAPGTITRDVRRHNPGGSEACHDDARHGDPRSDSRATIRWFRADEDDPAELANGLTVI
jgi:hypothetical protein